jgi:hypothetical protein
MKTKTSSKKVPTPFSLRQSVSRPFPLAPTLVAAALIACCPLQTRADTIALSVTGSVVFFHSGADRTEGWAFVLSSPVLVTQLGLFDNNNDGLADSHVVNIWTSTGTLEAQGTIPSGTGTTLTDGFRYVSIVPVLLPAGFYTIGGFYSGDSSDEFADAVFLSGITTASGVTYNSTRDRPGLGFPSGNDSGISFGLFGPNFQFTTPVSTPDSGSTWALLLLGVTAAFGLNLLLHRRSKA